MGLPGGLGSILENWVVCLQMSTWASYTRRARSFSLGSGSDAEADARTNGATSTRHTLIV